MDRTLDDLVTGYIKTCKAFSSFKKGIIKADGLDMYPLSRAVRLIEGKHHGRVFVICSTDEWARNLYTDLQDRDDIPVAYLPSDGKQLYSAYTASRQEYEQKKALDAIYEMKSGIVVTSLRAFVSPLLSPKSLSESSLVIRKGDDFDPVAISARLAEAGYFSAPSCSEQGSFSKRGEVIDIFPFASDEPLRIYGEWDEIVRIASYDLMTQRAVKDFPRVSIPLISGASSPGMSSIADYLSADDYFVLSGVERIDTSWHSMIKEAEARYREAYREDADAVLPSRILLDWEKFSADIRNGFFIYDIADPSYEHFSVSSSRSYFGNVRYFKDDISALIKNGWRIFVIAPSDVQRERLESVLRDYDATILVRNISAGFQIEDINLLTVLDSEIFGRRKSRSKSIVETVSSPLDSFVDLKEGDYVVHVNFGIGIFVKIDRVKSSRAERDYIKIEYADKDFLYVPIEQADLVQKYIGNDGRPPKLDRLGSQSWTKKKEKAIKNAAELAAELVQLYAKRQTVKGFQFLPDNDWQIQFEASFPYSETPDQLKCLDDVKSDMESDKVMDRLICGDVGYGKTEIAFRAAFKAVMSGKQVAFLAPTVILAEQHFNNFRKRLGDFPVKAAILSRYVTAKDQTRIRKELQEGRIDVLFGTHKILQKSVRFKDLGLLIIDEEQRFGVKHKEVIKQYKASIDSLALSATPIPRTLYMSLLKIRDMSLLTTAPRERQEVRTEICRFSEKLIGEAIRRELDRGGQVFFLHNRIDDLEDVCQSIRSEVKHAIVESAHGQMDAETLEDVMHRFVYEGIQVLVSTTIIENGIDIPNVNTIIIDHADRFGLSQLYQLRGRVGRSDRQAYCYLLYDDETTLNNDAIRRLRVLSENTALGSGFKVAMKDMEIRGAGNILGREQSGNLEAVGLDMYMRLVEEEVDKLTSNSEDDTLPVLLELDYSGFIPDSYIPEPAEKFEVYKKIASVFTEGQLEGLRAELENRYGTMSEEVENLFCIAEIKIICRHLSITHLKESKGVVEIEFGRLSAIKPERVISLLRLSDGKVQLDSKRMNYMRMETSAVSLRDKALFILEQLRRLE